MQVTYRTETNGARIDATITLPSGDVIEHSVPVAVCEAEPDPKQHLEDILARVAENHASDAGPPAWVPASGEINT
jgi:hypothetical protein